MKKTLIPVLFLSSIIMLANEENSIKTKVGLSDNLTRNKNTFSYDTSINLNLKANDIIKLEFDLGSGRKNILKSDNLNNELKDKEKKSRDLNIKLGAYVDYKKDDMSYKVDIIKNISPLGYLESNRENKNNTTGNLIINGNVKGTFKGIGINTNLNLKTNGLYENNDEDAYFKFNYDINKKFNEKYTLSSNYNFDIDLDLLTRPYKPLEREEDDIPETMVNQYVTKFNNKFNLSLLQKRESKNDEIKYGFSLDDKTNLASKEKSGKIDIANSNTNISLDFGYNNYLKFKNGHKLTFNNTLMNKINIFSEATKSRNFAPDDRKTYVAFRPTLDSKVIYDYNKNSLSSSVNLGLNYYPSINVNERVLVRPNKLNHNLEINLNSNISYEKDKHNFKFDTKNKFVTKFYENSLTLNFNNEINGSYSLKFLDDGIFNTTLRNVLNLNTKANGKMLDGIDEKFEWKSNVSKNIFRNDKHSLDNVSHFEYINSSNYLFEYKTVKKLGESEGRRKIEISQREDLNKLYLDTEFKHKYKVLNNLDINSSIKNTFELDMLMVKPERIQYNMYKLPSDKSRLITSDSYKKVINIGGKIEIEPSINVNYEVIKNLILNGGLKTNIVFERNILDKVDDSDRVDNGLYSYADKNFGFKKFIPKAILGLEYKW